MSVSPTTATNTNTTQTSPATPLEKAIETQEKQAKQILDNAQKQSEETTAQKTGIGGNVNLMA